MKKGIKKIMAVAVLIVLTLTIMLPDLAEAASKTEVYVISSIRKSWKDYNGADKSYTETISYTANGLIEECDKDYTTGTYWSKGRFRYDSNNRIENAWCTQQRDGSGRVIQLYDSYHEMTYNITYGSNGLCSSVSMTRDSEDSPWDRFAFSYNSAGLLAKTSRTGSSDSEPYVCEYRYDSHGNVNGGQEPMGQFSYENTYSSGRIVKQIQNHQYGSSSLEFSYRVLQVPSSAIGLIQAQQHWLINDPDKNTPLVAVYKTPSTSGVKAIVGNTVNDPVMISSANLSQTTFTYTGKEIRPGVTVEAKVDGSTRTLQANTDYTISYKSNTNAGTATVTINGKGKYTGSITKTFKINKAKNTLSAKGRTVTVKYSKVKKKAQKIKAKKAVTVQKNQGKVTYKKTSGNKKIKVSSSGKITVKKGLKKGNYKIKVKVTAAGNANYKKLTKTVTVKVKVK